MHLSARQFLGREKSVLFILWLLATILNIDKAFHIDDTFHLEAAKWIEQNPSQPMSGFINWDNNRIGIYHYNQPPLYFYMIAAVGSLFSYSEVPLHLFQSLFTLLSIYSFYKIAAYLCPKHTLLLTTLFALNPAFLVNQNLMVDIPLLSLHLLFIYVLIKPDVTSSLLRYGLAAAILSIALLIKYTTHPLIILLLLTPIIRRESKYAVAVLLPVLVLGLWSVFNYAEYGAIHLSGRSSNPLSYEGITKQLLSFILCLGAIAPFTIAFFTGASKRYGEILKIVILLAVLIFLAVIWLWYVGVIAERVARIIYWGGFMINGITAVVLAISCNYRFFLYYRVSKENEDIALIILWGAGLGAFIILFAPFMATRHVLLVIPPILLLCGRLLDRTTTDIKALAILATVALSLVLGVSDWVYADFYRSQAYRIKNCLPESATIWSVGHWGWQWYSKDAGMREYESDFSKLEIDDYIVIPENVAKQLLNTNVEIEEVKSIVPPNNPLTYFSTSLSHAFYTSDYIVAPWALTKAPIDTIRVFQVKGKID